MPLPALLMLAALSDWVPARWATSDPASLELLQKSPVNCLLLEKPYWLPGFLQAAAQRQIAALAVVHPGPDALENARRAASLKVAGVVLEGDFESAALQTLSSALADSKVPAVALPARRALRFDQPGITGTYQGVWPGIQVEANGEAKAAPSGAPWIDTNSGFLRFMRASVSGPFWIAQTPPAQQTFPIERYLQAIGDAAMVGARWVLALDSGFQTRLMAREAKAVKDWERIGTYLRFLESHKEWRELRPYGKLAIVQDVDSGALLSGGILDMIAVKHTPVRPVQSRQLDAESVKGAEMAVDVDPAKLTPEQKAILKSFTRAGGMLLTGPPNWKFPAPEGNAITLGKEDTAKLDQIWKEVNGMTGRRNLGARLFNVSSMLSSLMTSRDGKTAVLHLVNFSDYPVEAVTVHLLGKYAKVTLLTPEGALKELATFEVEDGTGVEIDKVAVHATLILE